MQHILTDITDENLVLTLSVARIQFLDFNQKKKLLKKAQIKDNIFKVVAFFGGRFFYLQKY